MKNLITKLSHFNKIIVTGCPRSGTTISGLILAHELGYKFIDETYYNGTDIDKFIFFLSYAKRKMVIQCTAFMKDLYKLDEYFNIAIVLIRRNYNDILKSFKNSENFKIGVPANNENGTFIKFNKESLQILANHFEINNDENLPKNVYKKFIKPKNLFELNYEELENHKLFVKKQDRRKYFKHLKQVKIGDPNYLVKKGVMVLS